jgi:DNA repair protein RecO (recombination protein O)
MFIHYRTLGIVLKKEDKEESSQIFTIYTKDFGKLRILGKAIRKIKSKLRAGVQLFCFSEVEFIQGKAYKTLTDAVLLEKFRNKELNALRVAFKISKAVDILIKGEEPDNKTWRLLSNTMEILNKPLFSISYSLVYYYFLWNFFSILGYKPELNRCASCRNKLQPAGLYFSSESGGIICSNCCSKSKGKKIKPETIKILRIIIKKDWYLFKKLKIEFEQEKQLDLFSKYYFNYFCEASENN